MVLLLSFFTGSVYGGFEGNSNTFYGNGAGINTTGDTEACTFLGVRAGYSNTTGYYNTFLGYAGYLQHHGLNTFLGAAGYQHHGPQHLPRMVGQQHHGTRTPSSEMMPATPTPQGTKTPSSE